MKIPSLTLQAIDAQSRNFIFAPLEELCVVMIYETANGGKPSEESLSKYTKLIIDKLGFSAELRFIDGFKFIYTEIPCLSEGHTMGVMTPPMVEKVRTKVKQLADLNHGDFTGTIDEKNVKVSGIFSKIDLTTYIGMVYLDGTYTAGETAAAILWELGLMFSYFNLLGETLIGSSLIKDAIDPVIREKDPTEKRIKFERLKRRYNKETGKTFDVSVDDMVGHTDTQNIVVFYGAYVKSYVSAQMTEMLDYTIMSRAADRFVARCGGSPDFVSLLKKQGSLKFNRGITFFNVFITMFLALAVFSSGGFFAFLMAQNALALLMPCYIGAMYQYFRPWDSVSKHIRDARRDVIEQLKYLRSNSDRKAIESLLSHIDAIDEAANASYPASHMVYVDILALMFSSKYRTRRNQEKLYNLVDTLINNDLFLKAIQLEQKTH